MELKLRNTTLSSISQLRNSEIYFDSVIISRLLLTLIRSRTPCIINSNLVCFVGCSHPGVENLVEKATTDLEHAPYMVIGGFYMGNAIEQEIHDTIERLLELDVKKIFPIHCCGDLIRQYTADHYPQQYGQANVGFQMTINIFTINPIVYFVVIPALIVSLTVLTGWFMRKKIKRSKASSD